MAMPAGYLENELHSNSVNGFDLNNNSKILLNTTFDVSNEYSKNVQNDFTGINPKNMQIGQFKQRIKSHLNNIYTYIDFIYQIKFFNNEFHKGCSIKNIANYILRDDELFIKYCWFLLDLIDIFIVLCKFKTINRFEVINNSKCKKEYNELSNEFRKKERYFYTHIYQPSENYDKEFLDKMTNLLVR